MNLREKMGEIFKAGGRAEFSGNEQHWKQSVALMDEIERECSEWERAAIEAWEVIGAAIGHLDKGSPKIASDVLHRAAGRLAENKASAPPKESVETWCRACRKKFSALTPVSPFVRCPDCVAGGRPCRRDLVDVDPSSRSRRG